VVIIPENFNLSSTFRRFLTKKTAGALIFSEVNILIFYKTKFNIVNDLAFHDSYYTKFIDRRLQIYFKWISQAIILFSIISDRKDEAQTS
jgi:hypothetical protein